MLFVWVFEKVYMTDSIILVSVPIKAYMDKPKLIVLKTFVKYLNGSWGDIAVAS